MDTLLLTHKIETIGRDRLYFDVYEYCVHFELQDVAAIKLDDHEKINNYLAQQEWRRKINFGGSWRWHTYGYPITDRSKKNCHTAHDNLKNIAEDYKLVTSYNCGYFYLNNLESAFQFLKSPGMTVSLIKQVVVNRPKDTIVIKSAKHDLRTYFKNQRLELEHKNILANFLKDRSDIRLSPGLQEWITSHYRYVCDNYFIDHDDDGFLTMLCLVSPIKIKKTFTLLTE